MNIKQIYETYLPLLQELQTRVAASGNEMLKMEVRTGHNYLLGDITLLNEDGTVNKFCHRYFFAGIREQEHDEAIIDLNAFFGLCCMVKAEDVECVICEN